MSHFYGAAPIVGKEDLLDSHSFMRFLGISDVNVQFEVLIGNSGNWDSGKSIKMLVVVSDKVLVGGRTDDCDDAAEGESNMCNIRWRVGEELCKEFSEECVMFCTALDSDGVSGGFFPVVRVAYDR